MSKQVERLRKRIIRRIKAGRKVNVSQAKLYAEIDKAWNSVK